jgi:capsular polysaccharide biosynthesis protein
MPKPAGRLPIDWMRPIRSLFTQLAQGSMDLPNAVLPLTLPAAEALVARRQVTLLQGKSLWQWDAPDMVVNLSDDLTPPDLLNHRMLKVHATYTGSYTNQYLFGFHHLHALVGSDGEFNCQEIENYTGRLSHHLRNLPPKHYLIPDITVENGSYKVDFARLRDTPPERLSGYTFFASPIEPENWGMWLLNGLLSAFAYTACGQPGRFLCYSPYKWQQDLLHFIGVWPGRLVQQKPWKTYECERIALLQYSRIDLVPDLHSKAIFANIVSKCASIDVPIGEKLFISRKAITQKLGGNYRALRNETELIEALERCGYMVIEPEQLPFRQQVRLFSAARIVVGLGGAAMFNTAFCRPGTKVISIESTGAFALNHARLFASFGLRYGFIFGQQTAEDGRFPHNSWTIDVDRAVRAIQSFE